MKILIGIIILAYTTVAFNLPSPDKLKEYYNPCDPSQKL